VLIIGGMSSLAGAATVLPYAFLFAMTRQRRYLVGSAVLAVTLVAQLIAYSHSARAAMVPLRPGSDSLQELRNFSYYALRWLKPTDSDFLAFVGACMLLAILGVVAYAAFRGRTPNTTEVIALVLGLLVVGVLSSIPGPLLSDPSLAGPRYYFLPYVVLAWVLLMIAVTSELRWARVAATVTIVMSLLMLSQTFSRHDDLVNWSRQLARCQTTTKTFTVPVQFDGSRADLWRGLLIITPQTCRNLGYH
jgi:hypothetical protein